MMDVMWSRLPAEVRDRIDIHLQRRQLIPAIMVLRTEGGLDPVPGLHEAQEVLVERSSPLAQQGLLEPRPHVEVAVVAIEAVWDGDTRRGQRLPGAAQIGEGAAAYLDVPFHFTDPNHPDVGLARWWDGDRVSPRPMRQYHYVGPGGFSATAIGPSGWRITSGDDLQEWIAGLPIQDRGQPQTFIVDAAGTLRVAPRRSEHIACADGRPVLSAGEISFARSGQDWSVTAATNQSTGFCPEVSSWLAVAAACERAGLAHPGRFTTAFEFRRCIDDCDQINIVKDSDFTLRSVWCGASSRMEHHVVKRAEIGRSNRA